MARLMRDNTLMELPVPGQTQGGCLQAGLLRMLKLAARGMAWGNVRCRSCSELALSPGQSAASGHAGTPLCAACAALLLPRLSGYCPACGRLFPNVDLPPAPCADCLRQPPPWSGFYFFAGYEHLVRSLFVAFKFHGDLAAGRLLAKLLNSRVSPALAKDLAAAGKAAGAALLVPVPVHKKRLQERGFNQSLLLAEPLAGSLRLRLAPQALWRTRLDPPQSSLDRKARLVGPKGAFAAHALVRGCEIVLVDDVMTTGATLREAARILLEAGALGVRIVVLARTPSSLEA